MIKSRRYDSHIDSYHDAMRLIVRLGNRPAGVIMRRRRFFLIVINQSNNQNLLKKIFFELVEWNQTVAKVGQSMPTPQEEQATLLIKQKQPLCRRLMKTARLSQITRARCSFKGTVLLMEMTNQSKQRSSRSTVQVVGMNRK